MKLNKNIDILHLDGSAGLTVGVLLFLLQDWVGSLYNLPSSAVLFLATANVCYGVYALSLALSDNRKAASISLLAVANAAWMVVCIVVVLLYAQTANFIGLTFICLEGIFVSILGLYEWKNRYVLSEVCCA